eukprot:sb/3475237/
MDLLGGAYSDSDSDSDSEPTAPAPPAPREPSPIPADSTDDELDDIKKDQSDDEGRIPLPDLELDSSGIGKTSSTIDPKVSVFRNEYVTEREEKQAVMEQHVTMTNSLTSLAERNVRENSPDFDETWSE